MPIEIPKSVIREIELIDKGIKRIRRPIKKELSDRSKLINEALARVSFLNEIANSEQISSFLVKSDTYIVIVPDIGSVVLANVDGASACYLYCDFGRPNGKKYSSDFKLIQAETFGLWRDSRIKEVSRLTKREIWKIILNQLRVYRE